MIRKAGRKTNIFKKEEEKKIQFHFFERVHDKVQNLYQGVQRI
jgi:hypothetical protein